jgi:hypothetical protein
MPTLTYARAGGTRHLSAFPPDFSPLNKLLQPFIKVGVRLRPSTGVIVRGVITGS